MRETRGPARPAGDRHAILVSAARALGRIDTFGLRGLTDVSVEAIGDMAVALLMLGLRPIPPARQDVPEPLILPRLIEET